MHINRQILLLFGVIILLVSIPTVFAQQPNVSHNEEYYLHAGDYPENISTFWGGNDALTNGITHDDNNWYITALGTDCIGRPNDDWDIKKIPVGEDLISGSAIDATRRGNVHVLDNLGYNHAGDLDHFKYGNNDYLIVPFEKVGSLNLPAAIAVFRCSNLSFIGYATLPNIGDGIGWCAVSPADSCLYTSNDDADSIFQYNINWSQLASTGSLSVSFISSFPFKGMNGDTMHNMQGGEFTPSGRLLYINSGIISACYFSGCPCKYQVYPNDGLHVLRFDGTSWQEIQHSTSNVQVTDFSCATQRQEIVREAELGCFDYSFDNTGVSGEEPEGLTIWDMDSVPGHNSHVSGQLHVISYNHNNHTTCPFTIGNDNTVYLKHYYYSTMRIDAGADMTAECTSPTTTPVALSCQVSNAPTCQPLTFLWSASGIAFDAPASQATVGHFPEGTALVTIAVSVGPVQRIDTILVRIVDTTPPQIITKPDHIVLWPPDHKYHTITVNDCVASAKDICDNSPLVTVLSVTSNEPLNTKGAGNTMYDAVITCPNTVQLRAERGGGGNGRIYSITYAATDNWGNRSTAVSHVIVPHDHSGKPVIAEPAMYTVTASCDHGSQFTPEAFAISDRIEPIPTETALLQNYPNPFNPTTNLRFSILNEEFVSLKIFDVLGREVSVLVNEVMEPGVYSVTWDATNVPSGVYFYQLQAGTLTNIKKLLLMK